MIYHQSVRSSVRSICRQLECVSITGLSAKFRKVSNLYVNQINSSIIQQKKKICSRIIECRRK